MVLSSRLTSLWLSSRSRFRRAFPLSIACAVAVFSLSATVLCQEADPGIRADLPLNGRLRVENKRGNIDLQVWSDTHIGVSAFVKGSAATADAVTLERADDLLVIGTQGAPARSSAALQIDLVVRVPERALVELRASKGLVLVHGLPASLAIESDSANVRVQVPPGTDADIAAESVAGKVDTSLAGDASPGTLLRGRVFKTRLGAGGHPVQIRTRTGNIALVQQESAGTTASEERVPPRLTGPRNGGNGNGSARRPAVDPATVPQVVDEGDVVRVDTQLTTLNVSVIDRGSNRGLAGLSESDFQISEDGVNQQILHFDSEAAPFNLILLIDLSGSTSEVVGLIRSAALRFVAAARPIDSIEVITFSNTPVVVSELTSNRVLLRRRINAIEPPHGSTKLYDAIDFAMNEVKKNSKDSRRNAIVLMSDGLDSTLPNVAGAGSTLSYKELLDRLKEFDGVLYSLWVDTEYEALSDLDVQPQTFDLAHDRMRELADVGGGMFYEVEKLEDLAGAYERVVADLGTVYSLSYRPSNKVRDGRWRTVHVTVSRANAVARGKHGYYAR